jgi:hypothetical protein
MPQALAAVPALFAQAVGTVLYSVAGYAAAAYAINKAANALTKKGKTPGAGAGLEVSAIDTSAAGRIIYGRVRIGGVNVIPPSTSGSNGEILHSVLAIAIHEVDSFESVYLDTDEVLAANITAITGNANDGLVTGSSKYAGTSWLRCYAGTTSQSVDFKLNAAFPSSFTSNFRGRGIAYIASSFDWGKGKTYESGVPNIAVVVKGKKCYDPRLDPSPGASPTNPTNIAWTENPALVWADYKMSSSYGQKCASTDIDWASVIDAADACDVAVTIPGGTEPRYTFNGMLSADAETRDNERQIVDAMLGKTAFTGGQYRIFAGVWRAPVYEIEKEDWVSIGAIQTTASRGKDRFNGVATYHVDESRNWQRVECFRRFNDTYKSADAGERVWVDLEQQHCTSKYEAERKGEFTLRQSRNGVRLTGVLPPRFLRLRTWDNVALYFDDLGWSGKTFTVASCVPQPDGSVAVVLQEEQDSDWTDLLSAEYGSPSIGTPPTTNPTTPSALPLFNITELLGTMQFDLGEPVIRPYGTRYQILRSVATLAVPTSTDVTTVIWEGIANRVVLPGDMRSYYWYHGRAIVNSYESALLPNTFGTGARPWIGPEAMPGNRAYPDGEFFFASGSYWAAAPIANNPSNSSYWIVTSNGITPQRGYLAYNVPNSVTFSDGAGVSGQTRIYPLRFDINSRTSVHAVPCFPGQTGTVQVLVRPNGVLGATPTNLRVRVAPISVNSPKATAYGSPLISVVLNTTIAASGQWAVTVASFTMPTSTIYDAVHMYLQVPDPQQNPSYVEIGGMQLSTN